MRYLHGILMMLAIAAIANADDIAIAKAKAKASLLLAQAHRTHTPTDAKAHAAAVLHLVQCQREREASCTSDLAAAQERAARTGKPLFVWVGMTCTAAPEIRKAFAYGVHCHVDANNGDTTPRLLVQGRDGRFWPFLRANFGTGTVEDIRMYAAPPTPQKQSALPATRPGRNC